MYALWRFWRMTRNKWPTSSATTPRIHAQLKALGSLASMGRMHRKRSPMEFFHLQKYPILDTIAWRTFTQDPVKRYKPLVVHPLVSSSSFPLFSHNHGQWLYTLLPAASWTQGSVTVLEDCIASTEANISERSSQLHGLHGLHVRYRRCDRTGSAALGTFFLFFSY